jgi:hypothetical protein
MGNFSLPSGAQRPAPTVCAFFFFPFHPSSRPGKKNYLAHGRPLGTPFPPCPLVPSAQQSFVGLETSFFGLESRFSRPKKVDPLVDRWTAERELFIARNGGNQQWC